MPTMRLIILGTTVQILFPSPGLLAEFSTHARQLFESRLAGKCAEQRGRL
jgi:hypothetical protein